MHLNDDHLTAREKDILRAVIHSYIMSGEPVASKGLVSNFNLGVSSATVRNVLSSLEKKGCIRQLHTSSGRVPTDDGYRVYVNSLMNLRRLTHEEEQRIEKEYFQKRRELRFIMDQTSKALSTLTECTGLIQLPKSTTSTLKEVKVLRVDEFRVIVLALFQTGVVKEKIIFLNNFFHDQELELLNSAVNMRVRGEKEANIQNLLLNQGSQVMPQKVWEHVQIIAGLDILTQSQDDILLNGQSNIASHPEFCNYEKLARFMGFVENKSQLRQMLESRTGAEGASVMIGDSELGAEDYSVVAAKYHIGDEVAGHLGVIGPKRMKYSRVVSTVEAVSSSLSRYLTKFFKS